MGHQRWRTNCKLRCQENKGQGCFNGPIKTKDKGRINGTIKINEGQSVYKSKNKGEGQRVISWSTKMKDKWCIKG